ncbi:iron-containing alcohol dehydrogenase [Tardiphaga sp. 42S5]|uniref:iron-containing alcohol dehydrogenase n=1 Tax=Tardiphaga sp. 42S5 TaxID=1404799 RepID=UPI002A5A1F49|nr:iron-containing alcohol dehydrogenase [Tardiphaga sp. 42S5]WPO43959.1 iron-containing alcohol dehydrogenase [Tardiphaga sp. 42S5]
MREEGFHQFIPMDRVIYGKPAATAILEEAERLDARRVYLIVSRTLKTTTDEIEKIRSALGARYAGEFDGVAEHTTREQAVQAASRALEARADLLVAVGGGSVIDAGKIVIMCMEHEIREESGLDGYEVVATPQGPRMGPFRTPKVRMISVPSTLSGGEYNAGTLVTDTRRKLKQIFAHPMMAPISVILDPHLARHTPLTLWLGSGTRAMDHGIEAICSPFGNPLVDGVCLRGLRFLHDGLLAIKADPDSIEARRTGQFGSWLSAYGLSSRVRMGASHGIGHVLGGTCNVPHYFCTAVMMPSVLKYNAPATGDAQAQIADALRSPELAASDAFARLIDRLDLPRRLSDVGVNREQFNLIAENAMLSIFTRANPQPIKSAKDVVSILEMAA